MSQVYTDSFLALAILLFCGILGLVAFFEDKGPW